MASSGTIVCMIYAFGITVGVANSFLEMDCDKINVGQFGQQSLLKCVIKRHDVKVRLVIWRKMDQEEKPLLVFQETIKKQVDGFGFAYPSWSPNNMDVSLLIDNTKVEDEGEYECSVVTDGGDRKMTTHLKVKAKYNQPTIKETKDTQVLNAKGTLICESFGGYPEGKLRWFDKHNKDWTKSSNTTITKMESGLFKISSQLPLFALSTFDMYSCKVYDSNGNEEDKVIYEPTESSSPGANQGEKNTKQTTYIAPVVVIGSLIVGLLLALLLYRRRNQSQHEHVETQDPDVETGDPEEDVQYSQP
ncbi:butyrophilin subfamily 1 member A1 isoform X2 [Oryzias melastigma]|uniref:Butyrophilin subfamily 1 member A1-like n=1 Tax=Oryzias melastigma TaxID=30732 RepID=A0A3B3DT14_ORYME|nr:butyrophilin subfamily 1 member A1 isoform X2 [Oryzias melastigma]